MMREAIREYFLPLRPSYWRGREGWCALTIGLLVVFGVGAAAISF